MVEPVKRGAVSQRVRSVSRGYNTDRNSARYQKRHGREEDGLVEEARRALKKYKTGSHDQQLAYQPEHQAAYEQPTDYGGDNTLDRLRQGAKKAGLIGVAAMALATSITYPAYTAAHAEFNIGSPALVEPAEGAQLAGRGTTARFQLSGDATQYQIQVFPSDGDGPGINFIRNKESSLGIEEPESGVGNYVMKPGKEYTWKVRQTSANRAVGENDQSWGPWAQRTFRTAYADSNTIKPLFPEDGGILDLYEPALYLKDSDTRNYYYRTRVSTDPFFGENGPVAPVWDNAFHGGVTKALNSFPLPQLQSGQKYYWQVKLYDDGGWSPVWTFTYMSPGGATTTINNFASSISEGLGKKFKDVRNTSSAQRALETVGINASPGVRKVYEETAVLDKYLEDKEITEEEANKIEDEDGDGFTLPQERRGRSRPFDRLDTPGNPSKMYVVSVVGFRDDGQFSRKNESFTEAGPHLVYLAARDAGVPDEDNYLFSQNSFPAVVGVLERVSSQYLYDKLDVTKGDEALFVSLVQRAGLNDKHTAAVWVEAWRKGLIGLTNDLLSAYGPVVADYNNAEVTNASLEKAFAEIRKKIKPNDRIVFDAANHGIGTETPGSGFLHLGNDSGISYKHLKDLLTSVRYGEAVVTLRSSFDYTIARDAFNQALDAREFGGPTVVLPTTSPTLPDGTPGYCGGGEFMFHMFTQAKEDPLASKKRVWDKAHETAACRPPVYGNTSLLDDLVFPPKAQ